MQAYVWNTYNKGMIAQEMGGDSERSAEIEIV